MVTTVKKYGVIYLQEHKINTYTASLVFISLSTMQSIEYAASMVADFCHFVISFCRSS